MESVSLYLQQVLETDVNLSQQTDKEIMRIFLNIKK